MQDNSSKDDFGLPVDKGWAQMEAQLDEAMPQRRRRALWWWWLPALALMLGVGLYTWSLVGQGYSVGSGEEAKATTEDIPVAGISSERALEVTSLDGQEGVSLAEAADQATVASAPKSKSQFENTKPFREQLPEPLLASERQIVPNAMEAVAEAKPLTNYSSISEFERTTASTTQIESSTPILQNTITDSSEDKPLHLSKTRSLATAVAPLAYSPLSLLPKAALAAGALPEVSPVRSSPKYRFYAEVLAGEALEDQFSSVLLGFGVERSLGSAWKVSGGLQFQYSQSNLYSGIRNDEDIALGVESPTTGGGLVTFYDISNGFNVLKTQRFNIYTQLGYQIHPRLKIGAGLQASSFQQATAGIASADEYNQETDPTLVDYDARELDLYEESVSVASFDQVTNAYSTPRSLDVRRWQWSAQSSISYRLHPAWSLELQYLRHLTAWPAKGESFGGPHNLQLGFRYYFRK